MLFTIDTMKLPFDIFESLCITINNSNRDDDAAREIGVLFKGKYPYIAW